jgi:DNA repair protein RecN (Recombination protein N)
LLRELSITDIAIIPEVELRFDAGLNVLSGETGAGKSLVVGGLRLLCGEKPPPDFVREGEERGVVEAVFELERSGWIAKRLSALGLEVEDGELILRREIAQEGKGRVRANGQAIPLRLLAEASELLVDLHGQHDHQSLLRPSWQLEALDEFAKLSLKRERFAEELDALRAARAELATAEASTKDDAERAELRRFQREELDRARPVRGELEALTAERGRLERATQLKESAALVVDGLVDAEGCVRDALAKLAHVAGDAARHDPEWGGLRDALSALAVNVDETGRDARRLFEETAEDPERLAFVRERVHLLEDLRKKYGDEDALFAQWERLREEGADPASRTRRVAALREREGGISDRLRALGLELSERRAASARRLVSAVTEALEELGMPGARFDVQLVSREAGTDVGGSPARLAGPSGLDACELLLAPNRGGRLLPLRSAASGGELSRVMLALKSVLGETRGTATMVFDEIDHGIGGLVAGRVGRRLEELAASRQILCITHLPQIASRASVHFRVRKEDHASGVVTTVERVEGEGRVQEIARMLGAADGRGAAVEHARELLAGDRT